MHYGDSHKIPKSSTSINCFEAILQTLSIRRTEKEEAGKKHELIYQNESIIQSRNEFFCQDSTSAINEIFMMFTQV